MSYETDLKTSLRGLDVPEHRPGFWAELDLRLEEGTDDGVRPRTSRRPWRALFAGIVAVAVAVVALIVVSPTSLTSTVLAYSYPEGDYVYDISYVSVPDPESIEAHGTLTYTVEENSDTGLTTVAVQTNVSDVNINCGHSACPEDLALLSDIPVVRFVVDSTGRLAQTPAPDSPEEFPELVLPDPLPGSNLYAGLPFGFGPPLPEQALDVGDSWTTTGSHYVGADDGPQFSAEHTVVGKETIVGRDTMVIRSVYQTQSGGGFQVTSETTVWFDPAAGIIVRAELERSSTTKSGDEIGTTEIVAELRG